MLMAKIDPIIAPPRSNEARDDHKAYHREYDRGQAFRGSEEEDGVGEYDPWGYEQSGAYAASYGGTQSTFWVVVYLWFCRLVTPRICSLLYQQ